MSKNSDITKGEKYKASSNLLLFLMFLFFPVLLLILYKPISGFKSYDELPPIVSITPQDIIDIGGAPASVDIGMYIRDIPTFDIVDGNVIADLTVWFIFDPSLVSIDIIGRFTFDRARIISKAKPVIRILEDKVIARYDVTGEFSFNLDYRTFPFDDHRISFSFTNYFLAPTDVSFKTSRGNLVINPEMHISGWKNVDRYTLDGYLLDKLDPYNEKNKVYHPRVLFNLDFARTGFRHIIVILMPLILIFLVSLLTWTFNPFGLFAGALIPISVMSITALIAHHFVIERMSPSTGYLMISNIMFVIFLLATCIVFIVNIFGRKISGFYKNILAILVYLSLVITFLLLVGPLF